MKVISHLFHVLYQILKKLYRTYTLCGAIDADNQGIVLSFFNFACCWFYHKIQISTFYYDTFDIAINNWNFNETAGKKIEMLVNDFTVLFLKYFHYSSEFLYVHDTYRTKYTC